MLNWVWFLLLLPWKPRGRPASCHGMPALGGGGGGLGGRLPPPPLQAGLAQDVGEAGSERDGPDLAVHVKAVMGPQPHTLGVV